MITCTSKQFLNIYTLILALIYYKMLVIMLMVYHIGSFLLSLCVATKTAQGVEETNAENQLMPMGND